MDHMTRPVVVFSLQRTIASVDRHKAQYTRHIDPYTVYHGSMSLVFQGKIFIYIHEVSCFIADLELSELV
jgi:hypothetical protein